MALFKTLPTYEWLSAAGITPGSGTYTLSQITSALKSASGVRNTFVINYHDANYFVQVTPALDCSGTAINQIYWYHHLIGSGIDGKFVLIGA